MLSMQIPLSAASAALTLVVVILLLRDARTHLVVRLGAAVFVCALGYSLILIHESQPLPMGMLQAGVLLNTLMPGLNWLFGRALLQERFRIRSRDWLVFTALGGMMFYVDADVFGFSRAPLLWQRLAQGASYTVMAHVLWIALSGFNDDLLSERRRARIWFVLFVLSSYGLLAVLEASAVSAVWRGLVYDLTTVAVTVTVILWAAQVRPEQLISQRLSPSREPVVKPGEETLHRRLIDCMEIEHVYREAGLSVAALAQRVGAPEYKLRTHINSALGYGNFAEFLNHYRLQEACAMLADPTQPNKSIFAVAMDAGYRSLSTFNRAFKARFGDTPTAFRNRMLEPATLETARDEQASSPGK
jgi:AraC-like DNA-binding protein